MDACGFVEHTLTLCFIHCSAGELLKRQTGLFCISLFHNSSGERLSVGMATEDQLATFIPKGCQGKHAADVPNSKSALESIFLVCMLM